MERIINGILDNQIDHQLFTFGNFSVFYSTSYTFYHQAKDKIYLPVSKYNLCRIISFCDKFQQINQILHMYLLKVIKRNPKCVMPNDGLCSWIINAS